GQWGWKADAIADYLQRHGRDQGVLHVGYVPEEHLGALYNGARALVYPSRYEGFGLPPLIAPEDVDGWRDGMVRVLVDDDWWHQLRHGAVDVVRRFTWERCAA